MPETVSEKLDFAKFMLTLVHDKTGISNEDMLKLMILLLGLFLWGACKRDAGLPVHPAIYNLATPIRLEKDTTRVYLTDYFLYPQKIGKITVPGNIKLIREKNRDEILLVKTGDIRPLENIRFKYEGQLYDIPLFRSTKKKVEITFDPKGKKYGRVQLAGDMNAWNPENTPLSYRDGLWKAELELAPGRYQYLLVLDGEKIVDPGNKERTGNGRGGVNSLLTVAGEEGEAPFIYTDRVEGDTVFLSGRSPEEEWIVYLQNLKLDKKYLIGRENGVGIVIPETARGFKRTELRIWAVNRYGVSNDILIPLEYGKVILNARLLEIGRAHV